MSFQNSKPSSKMSTDIERIARRCHYIIFGKLEGKPTYLARRITKTTHRDVGTLPDSELQHLLDTGLVQRAYSDQYPDATLYVFACPRRALM